MSIFISQAQARSLDDQSLREMLSQEDSGLIYVWSPRMPLSVKGLKGAAEMAQKLGVAFIPVNDPYAESNEQDWKMTSKKLISMGALNHFPTIVLFKNGELLPQIIPGFEVNEGLESLIVPMMEKKEKGQARVKSHNQSFTFMRNPAPSEVIQLNLEEMKTIHNESVPDYFYKINPSGRFISFSTRSNNFLLELETKKETKIPGPFDPVFNIGTRTLIVPDTSSANQYSIYHLSDIRNEVTPLAPLYTDATIRGYYESTGRLGKPSKNVVRFRVITEVRNGSHMTRDYDYDFKKMTITPQGEGAKAFCTNFTIKLPILSKNGREVGGVDVNTRKSAIFKIKDDGTCDKVDELDLITGKQNFSYDSRFVTYHIYRTDHTDYIERPDSGTQANVYVYDRKTKKTYQITTNTDRNSMYPDFTADGTLVMAEYPHNGSGVNYRFLKFKLPR